MQHLRINGVGRDHNNSKVVAVYTNKTLSDGELRVIHDLLTNHFNENGIEDAHIENIGVVGDAANIEDTARMEVLKQA